MLRATRGFLLSLAVTAGLAAAERANAQGYATESFGSGQVAAISADGSALIGSLYGRGAFRWTATDGLRILQNCDSATAISADGSVVVGMTHDYRAARWDAAGAVQLLAFDSLRSSCGVMTPSGSVVIGSAYVTTDWERPNRAVIWNGGGAGQDLGGGSANVISASGSVVAGTGTQVLPPWWVDDGGVPPFYMNAACRWSGNMQRQQYVGPGVVTHMSADGSVLAGSYVDFYTRGWRRAMSGDIEYFNDENGGSYPIGVSADGSVTVMNGSGVFLWQAGGARQSIGSIPGYPEYWVNATAMTPDASVVVGYGGFNRLVNGVSVTSYRAFRWSASTGMVDLGPGQAHAVSADGSVVGGESNWQAVVWRKDSDHDGLPDDWEVNGVPYEKVDGGIGRYPLFGANPLQKDIFVEVDSMPGRGLSADMIERLKDAFDPPDGRTLVPAVPGLAGGLPNINLHIQTDDADLNLALTNDGNYTLGTRGFGHFAMDKDRYFGQTYDRQHADWGTPQQPGPRRAAKLLAFRYCIFANSYGGTRSTGTAKGIVSDDFMVTLGASGGGSQEARGGTFMHELGHTLGLRHGGGDDINYKPNYLSVMNYHWQTPENWSRTTWSLRYSEEVMDPLDENNLHEPTGVRPGRAGLKVPYRLPDSSTCQGAICSATACRGLASLSSAGVDWDGSCVITFGPTAADINDFSYILPADASAEAKASLGHGRGVLTGHNDWAAIKYSFRTETVVAPSAGAEQMDCSFDDAVRELHASFPVPCAADLGAAGGVTAEDGHLDNNDFIVFITFFFEGNTAADFGMAGGVAGTDGLFDNNDFIVFIDQFFAGCG